MHACTADFLMTLHSPTSSNATYRGGGTTRPWPAGSSVEIVPGYPDVVHACLPRSFMCGVGQSGSGHRSSEDEAQVQVQPRQRKCYAVSSILFT
jgi:hypothetical protein